MTIGTKRDKTDKTRSKVLVGIIMGSNSDLSVMKEAADFLDSFGVSNELKIVSAHRTTGKLVRYGKQAKKRGIKVIIAGAGGAAHLPGMTASITSLPVIGVPIKTTSLDGLDSLLSIVQMPAGVPVATVAINGGKNAAILACQILGLKFQAIANKIERFKKQLELDVLQKAKEVERNPNTRYKSGSTKSELQSHISKLKSISSNTMAIHK